MTPLDAVIVANDIHRAGNGDNQATLSMRCDINGDGTADANDFIAIISYLASQDDHDANSLTPRGDSDSNTHEPVGYGDSHESATDLQSSHTSAGSRIPAVGGPFRGGESGGSGSSGSSGGTGVGPPPDNPVAADGVVNVQEHYWGDTESEWSENDDILWMHNDHLWTLPLAGNASGDDIDYFALIAFDSEASIPTPTSGDPFLVRKALLDLKQAYAESDFGRFFGAATDRPARLAA